METESSSKFISFLFILFSHTMRELGKAKSFRLSRDDIKSMARVVGHEFEEKLTENFGW